MKMLKLTALLLLLQGCASHPSNVDATKNVNYDFKDCKTAGEDVVTYHKEYVDLYYKQEYSFTGDIVLVSLIGLPLMVDHEEDLSEAFGKYLSVEKVYIEKCKKSIDSTN